MSEQSDIPFQGLIYTVPNMHDYTLDEGVDLEQSIPLDNGRHDLDPRFDLGKLEKLPLEVLYIILLELDLRSLTDFRRVNQRAMQVVDSLTPYQAIVKHSTNALRATLAIHTAQYMTCCALLDALSTAQCHACGDFAVHVDLLTCSRVCFLCFCENTNHLPLLATEVKRKYGIRPDNEMCIPRMQSLPGRYTANEYTWRKRLILYDHNAAREAALRHYGSTEVMEQHVAKIDSKRLQDYHDKVTVWTRSKHNPMPRRPPQILAWDGTQSNARRYMAVVCAPFYNVHTKSHEWGFHCIGCRDKTEHEGEHRARRNWRRRFREHTFEAHLEYCGPIVGGRHVVSSRRQ